MDCLNYNYNFVQNILLGFREVPIPYPPDHLILLISQDPNDPIFGLI